MDAQGYNILVDTYFKYETQEFGVYSYDTNTLEYFTYNQILDMIKKGYIIKDIPLIGDKIDINHVVRYNMPMVEQTVINIGKQSQVCLSLGQPIYIKDLAPQRYIAYNGIAYHYQAKGGGARGTWGAFTSQHDPVTMCQLVEQQLPYFAKGNKLVLNWSYYNQETLDLSCLNSLSTKKFVSLSTEMQLDGVKNIRIAGVFQNLMVGNFLNKYESGFDIIDLSGLYVVKKGIGTLNHNLNTKPWEWLRKGSIEHPRIIVLPQIPEFSKLVYTLLSDYYNEYPEVRSEPILLGLAQHQDPIEYAKNCIAKNKLMGKDWHRKIYLVTA